VGPLACTQTVTRSVQIAGPEAGQEGSPKGFKVARGPAGPAQDVRVIE